MVSFQNHQRETTWKVTVVFIHASSETPKRVLPVEGRTRAACGEFCFAAHFGRGRADLAEGFGSYQGT